MKKIAVFLAVALLAVFAVTWYSGTKNNSGDTKDKIKVCTSFYTMYDLTKKVGGDLIDIECIVPAGTEPHEWEPSPSDIAKLENADVFIYNGGGMEHWVDSVIPNLSNKKLKTLCGYDYAIAFGDADPHIWLSPYNADMVMQQIKNILCEADRKNTKVYEENYKKYSDMMQSLAEKILEESKSFKKYDIVVSHEAYGYLCMMCGVNQIAVEGITGESDPSPAKLAEITKLMNEKDIKYIFKDPNENSKAIETLAKETNAEILVLDPFEFNTEGKDYFAVMEENINALKKALAE